MDQLVEVIDTLMELADALRYMHNLGIVHGGAHACMARAAALSVSVSWDGGTGQRPCITWAAGSAREHVHSLSASGHALLNRLGL